MPATNTVSDVAATIRGVLETIQSLPLYTRDPKLRPVELRLTEIWRYLNALATKDQTAVIAPNRLEPIELRVWLRHVELISRLDSLLTVHDEIMPTVLIQVSETHFLFLTGFMDEQGPFRNYRIALVPETRHSKLSRSSRCGSKHPRHLS